MLAPKWLQTTLGDLVGKHGLFRDGDWVESKDQDPSGDVRLLQLADVGGGVFLDRSARYLTSQKAEELRCTFLKPGDLMIARMPDPIGRACIFPGSSQPCVTVVDVCILRPDANLVNSRWLLWKLNSPTFHHQIEQFATGTTRKRISRRNLEKLEIALPPIEEQRRIAAILDKADAIRRKRQEAIRLSEQFVRSAFLEMFGDPVTNPKGWPLKKLGDEDVSLIITGNTPPRSNPANYGQHIEWIKSNNVNTSSHLLTRAVEYLSEAGEKLGRTVGPGATLMTCIAGSRSSIGKVALTERKVAFNQQINALVPSRSIDEKFFYVLLLLSQRLVHSASTDAMKGLVSKGRLSEIEVPLPPPPLQERFGSFFDTLVVTRESFDEAETRSGDLFSSLAQRAFRGEL